MASAAHLAEGVRYEGFTLILWWPTPTVVKHWVMHIDSTTQVLPDGVFTDGERFWRASPGATSTFEENVAARKLFIDLHRDQHWNPWLMEDQADARKDAIRIMEEWERAEPGFKRKTERQVEAEMARWERDFERQRENRDQRRQENLKRFDAARDLARLELLEQECLLAHKVGELARLRRGALFPSMASERRAQQMRELDPAIEHHRAAVERLTPVVGDREDVPDQYGRLPLDRRPVTLYYYRERRIAEVREIRALLPDLEGRINATDDRAERSKLRAERDIKESRLARLLAVPRLEAKDMCADCATPAEKHGYVSPPFDWPCAAWPGQRAILEKVRLMLEAVPRRDTGRPDAPPTPKPEPLAVVPSGLPITEVVQSLQELQLQFPEAEVRRGRANRWELWSRPAEAQRGH